MGKRIKVKPGKGQSAVGFFVGIVFCLVGLFVAIPTFGLFGIFWTALAVVITFMNWKNAFTEKGITTHEIIIDDPANTVNNENVEIKSDAKSRLEEIRQLYESGFLTKEEYEEKRKNIIDSI